MRAIRLLQTVLLALPMMGCSSISSTHVERAKEWCGWKTTHMHGIPITLEVPHHFKISIIDTYYEKAGNVLRDTSAVPVGTVPPALKSRSVDVKVETTQEIFTVDFVRPAAGTLSTKASLDADRQYFTSIDNKVVDKTIQDITTAIGTLSQAVNPLLKSRALVQDDPTLVHHDRVVAVAFVEVADPNAREKIHDFLCQHLNGCGSCKPAPPSPPPPLPVVDPGREAAPGLSSNEAGRLQRPGALGAPRVENADH